MTKQQPNKSHPKKLTPNDVAKIRWFAPLLKRRLITQRAIAFVVKLSQSTVCDILNRVLWAHLDAVAVTWRPQLKHVDVNEEKRKGTMVVPVALAPIPWPEGYQRPDDDDEQSARELHRDDDGRFTRAPTKLRLVAPPAAMIAGSSVDGRDVVDEVLGANDDEGEAA